MAHGYGQHAVHDHNYYTCIHVHAVYNHIIIIVKINDHCDSYLNCNTQSAQFCVHDAEKC